MWCNVQDTHPQGQGEDSLVWRVLDLCPAAESWVGGCHWVAAAGGVSPTGKRAVALHPTSPPHAQLIKCGVPSWLPGVALGLCWAEKAGRVTKQDTRNHRRGERKGGTGREHIPAGRHMFLVAVLQPAFPG